MSKAQLQNLHLQFMEALKNHAYMGVSSDNKLQKTDTKSIRLRQVFKLAQKEIEDSLKKDRGFGPKHLNYLLELEKDGDLFYKRYTRVSNSWSRVFLKRLAYLTPVFFKPYLPACFSNRIAEADLKTKKKHDSYKNFLRTHIDEVNDVKKFQKFSDFFDDDENLDDKGEETPKIVDESSKQDFVALPIVVIPTKEEIDAQRQKNLEIDLAQFKINLQLLQQFEEKPLSLTKIKKILTHLIHATRTIVALDPECAKELLIKTGIIEAEFQILTDNKFFEAFMLNDDQKIISFLQSTSWESIFTAAANQKETITYAIRKLLGNDLVMIKNAKGEAIKDTEFQSYRGKVCLFLNNLNPSENIEKFIERLKANPNCKPNTIEIKVNQISTPDLIKTLLALSERVGEISIEGMEKLNFKDPGISEDDEYQFIQRLDLFFLPTLNTVTLSDFSKKDWKPQDFSKLLASCPKLELLQESFRLCTVPELIKIPTTLKQLKTMEFKNYSIEHVPLLLREFTQLTSINLSELKVTDEQLAGWIATGALNHASSLSLENCHALTTDSLHALMTLPHLTILSLPDLPLGKISLERLPKFNNPFKIKLFYTSSKVIQPLAADRYTGPLIWSAVFQIPLARQGVTQIFPIRMSTLDPKSVAYWLYENDYQQLQPQENIIKVVGDSNSALNDANLSEFMLKFPNAAVLSLYNCPNLSSAGIIKMLKACPNIQILDLTSCPQLTEDLFLEGEDANIFKNLKQICVNDIGISRVFLDKLRKDVVLAHLDKKINYEETILTISDDQLIDDQALENILKIQNLQKFKRINLINCKKLTNEMLGQLFDHLNADIWIEARDGTMQDNPQRLNLAVLDLTNCPNISEEAFDDNKWIVDLKKDGSVDSNALHTQKMKVTAKILENLDRIIIGGTKIKDVIKEVYPHINFQMIDIPLTIQIDPDSQLQMLQIYERKKFLALSEDEQKKLKALALTYVHNRIVIELFGSKCAEQESVEDLKKQPFNTDDKEFCDLTLTFKTNDAAQPCTYHAHRDVLYSHSLYFINSFRAGGMLSKVAIMDYVNLHATPQASKVLIDLLYCKAKIDDLDWQTAADAAELAGPHIFKLHKSLRDQLLRRIHSQFDLHKAEKMFMAAKLLDDTEGQAQYEATMLAFLDSFEGKIDSSNRKQFQAMANIANEYDLPLMKKKVSTIQKILTKKLTAAILKEQTKADEKLIQKMIANSSLKNRV